MLKKTILSALILFVTSVTSFAQSDYRVLSVHKASQGGKALEVGTEVGVQQDLIVENGGYLALVSADGKLKEFRESGTFKAATGTFESPLSKHATEKTAEFMLSNFIKSRNAKKAEAESSITLEIPEETKVYHETVPLFWSLHENKEDNEEPLFDVVVNNMLGDEVFKKTTNKMFYDLNLNNITTEEGIPEVWLCSVSLHDSPHASDAHTLTPLDETGRKEVEEGLRAPGTDYESPLANMLLANYFESLKLTTDAIIFYKKALKQSRNNEAVRKQFEGFKNRHKLI
jgi:hypothetical protein